MYRVLGACHPFVKSHPSITEIQFNEAFKIPNPDGEWSFISINGKNKTRIDHAIVADVISIKSAKYIVSDNGIVLAGSKNECAITDHAVLSLDVDV